MTVLELLLGEDIHDVISHEVVVFHGQAHHEPTKRHVECSRHHVEEFWKRCSREGRWSLVRRFVIMFSSDVQRICVPLLTSHSRIVAISSVHVFC